MIKAALALLLPSLSLWFVRVYKNHVYKNEEHGDEAQDKEFQGTSLAHVFIIQVLAICTVTAQKKWL